MKRILHIYKDFYPPVLGGIEKHLNLLCGGLSDEYQVRALVANTRPRLDIVEHGAVEVVKAPCSRRVASAPLAWSFPRLMREWPADILHFHHPNPTGELAWLWSRAPGKKIVTWHSDIVRQKVVMPIYGLFLQRFLRACDQILATSPNYIQSSKWLRRHESKCCAIPLGIDMKPYQDLARYDAAARRVRDEHGGAGPVIVFVGRLRTYKGLTYLLQAMERLDARLWIVGEGRERANLEGEARERGVADKVVFAGDVSDRDLPAWLRAADLFCLPSHQRSEAYGLAQIEAMACGLPVVACRLDSGVPYVNQEGHTGLLAEPAAPDSLREKIQTLLADPELRTRLGQQARARALREFDHQRMIQRVKAVYEEVLASPVG